MASTSQKKRRSGATTAKTSVAARFIGWFDHHRRVGYESAAQLIKDWVSSMMTWLVIGIALALPAILYLVLVNLADVSDDWDGKPRLSVYLDISLDTLDSRAFAEELQGRPEFSSARLITPEAALVEFRERSGFGDVLKALDRNPLPPVIELLPLSEDLGELRLHLSALENDERVDSVVFDLEWLERLTAMVAFGERLVMALALVLSLGVILVIGNTIRLAIENRRSEIEIVKLVGGTDAFVRRPFLYLGFWYGLGGAIIALTLLEISVLFLSGPVETLAQSYRNQFSLSGPGFQMLVLMLLTGGVLGVLGAATAVGRHLRQIEPG